MYFGDFRYNRYLLTVFATICFPILLLLRLFNKWYYAKYFLFIYRAVQTLLDKKGMCNRVYNLEYNNFLQLDKSGCLNLLNNIGNLPSARKFVNYYKRINEPLLAGMMKLKREPDIVERLGDLVVLKPFISEKEKGVILLQYNKAFANFLALFDYSWVAKHYQIVLEPSTWGIEIPELFALAKLNTDIFIQAQFHKDFEYIEDLVKRGYDNLNAVVIGAGDWVNPSLFSINENTEKKFDIVYVAAWHPLKRHSLLFKSIAKLGNRVKKIACVGYSYSDYHMTINDIKNIAQHYNIEEKCEWYEQVPPAMVAELIQQSRCSVLLSIAEGANRAVYESLFCNVPLIVSSKNIGIDRRIINEQTGLWANDTTLSDALASILNSGLRFSPRQWALENTGCHNSTKRLNTYIREHSMKFGYDWTQDIVTKYNGPHARYADSHMVNMMQPEYIKISGHCKLQVTKH